MNDGSNKGQLPRILLVDDEPAIRRFMQTVLADDHFALSLAENGHAALAAADDFLSTDIPSALNRLVLEGRDSVARALRARRFDAAGDGTA